MGQIDKSYRIALYPLVFIILIVSKKKAIQKVGYPHILENLLPQEPNYGRIEKPFLHVGIW